MVYRCLTIPVLHLHDILRLAQSLAFWVLSRGSMDIPPLPIPPGSRSSRRRSCTIYSLAQDRGSSSVRTLLSYTLMLPSCSATDSSSDPSTSSSLPPKNPSHRPLPPSSLFSSPTSQTWSSRGSIQNSRAQLKMRKKQSTASETPLSTPQSSCDRSLRYLLSFKTRSSIALVLRRQSLQCR